MFREYPGKWSNQARRCWRRAAASLALLCVFLACGHSGAASDLPPNAHERESPHFVFYYEPKEAGDVEVVQLAAEAAYTSIAERLRFRPEERIPVIIYSSRAEFRKNAKVSRTEFVVGTASSADNAIRLDGSEMLTAPAQVVGHEVAHIFLFRLLGNHVETMPLWMNEGLAQELGGEDPRQARGTVETALYEERLPPLTSLARDFPPSESAGLAYAQSQHAVNALLERGGWTNLLALLDGLKGGRSFDSTMREVYGVSAEEWDRVWMGTLRSDARRHLWMRYASWLIPLMMFIALGWGTLTVRRHRRVQAEEEAEPVGELEPPSWWHEDEFRI